MKPCFNHRWKVTTREARDIQDRLRSQIIRRGKPKRVRHVAGVDISIRDNRAIAAIVVLDFPSLDIAEISLAEQSVPFPYVPGLLSFREIPSIIAAARKLKCDVDIMLTDGQGIAHPRRFGLASHLGVLFGIPTIGCAKTRFIGTHDEPAELAGCYTDLWDGEELIGAVLRTRDHVKPLYISIGSRIELPTALDLVLECCAGYRLPEPTRLAHQAAGGSLRQP